MIRFCHNHGLIQVANRPQWWTVTGGARNYVDKIIAGIPDKRLNTPVELIERDDQGVRIITDKAGPNVLTRWCWPHTRTSRWRCCATPPKAEKAILGAIRYQPNRAVLHTDTSVLPKKKLAWAAWNYERAQHTDREARTSVPSLPSEHAAAAALYPARGGVTESGARD